MTTTELLNKFTSSQTGYALISSHFRRRVWDWVWL